MSDEPVENPVEEVVEPTTTPETVVEETKTETETETETETTTETVENTEAELKQKEEELLKMKAALELANETLAAYKAKEAEMMKQQKKAKRMAALIESGISNNVAEASIDKLLDIEDSVFDTVTTLVAAVKPKEKIKTKTNDNLMTEDSKNVKSSEISDVLDNVEVEQSLDLSVGGDSDSETQNTRAALIDFVYSRLGKKLNKGD